jgi:hypothetical protein
MRWPSDARAPGDRGKGGGEQKNPAFLPISLKEMELHSLKNFD